MDGDWKGSRAHLGRAEQGNYISVFNLTVSLGRCSLRKEEVPENPRGLSAAGGDHRDLSSQQ